MQYLVISRGEDEPYFHVMTKEQLEKELLEAGESYTFLDSFGYLKDLNHTFPEDSMLIVRIDKIVLPKAVEKIMRYEV